MPDRLDRDRAGARPDAAFPPDLPPDPRRPGFSLMPPTAPPRTHPVAPAFLAALRASGLFPPGQLEWIEAFAARTASAEETACVMVEDGLLTRFQADRLLAGKTDGYHLGPYVVLEPVGRGPSGRVYKGRHRTMNRLVAVKVAAPELSRTAADRETLQQAARDAARINHPNVVATYDANVLGERFYLVSEFVDGPSFQALVAERGPLPPGEACELVRQAAAGLAHAHACGVAHGATKPANLLVARSSRATPAPQVKIADFGLAARAAAGPAVGVEPDPRADVYSLGAVLYFLLAGRSPENMEPASRPMLRADVWPALAELAHQMLAARPEDRPSAAEAAARLDALAGGTPARLELPDFLPLPDRQFTGPFSNAIPHSPARTPAAATPGPTPSPWEQITEETAFAADAATETCEYPAPTGLGGRAAAAISGWVMIPLAAAVLAACLLAVRAVVRVMVA